MLKAPAELIVDAYMQDMVRLGFYHWKSNPNWRWWKPWVSRHVLKSGKGD